MAESFMEESLNNERHLNDNFSSQFFPSAGSGLNFVPTNSTNYRTLMPTEDLDATMGLSNMDPIASVPSNLANQDPYMDDDALQDEISGSYQHPLPAGMMGDSLRSSFNQGSYGNLRRVNQDAAPYLDRPNLGNYSNNSSMDYSAYPDGMPMQRRLNTPQNLFANSYQDELGEDDGIFIESMNGIADDNYVQRMYGNSSAPGMGDPLGDPYLSPRSRSPRVLDPTPHRPLFRDEDRLTPDLGHNFPSSSYGSFSVFHDGGIGIGRSYHNNSMMNLNECEDWNRTRSFNRNMNDLGNNYGVYQGSRASFSNLRSSSLTHAPTKDYDGYGAYGMNEPISPHRVHSMERIPTELGNNHGYGMRGLPHTNSFIDDSYNDRDMDIPMARAKSMMYLGDDDNDPLMYSKPMSSYQSNKQAMNTFNDSLYSSNEGLPLVTTTTAETVKSPLNSEQGHSTTLSSSTSTVSPTTVSTTVAIPSSSPAPVSSTTPSSSAPSTTQTTEVIKSIKSPSPATKPTRERSPLPLSKSTSPKPISSPKTTPASQSMDKSKSTSSISSSSERAKSPKPEWRQSVSPRPSSHHSPRPTTRSDRSKSPIHSPRDDDDHEKKHSKYRFPCRDFEKGVCSRGAACKFYHDPAKAVTTPDKIPICRDFSKGKCTRENCRFRHPGTHRDNVLMGLEEPATKTELEEIMKQFSSTIRPKII